MCEKNGRPLEDQRNSIVVKKKAAMFIVLSWLNRLKLFRYLDRALNVLLFHINFIIIIIIDSLPAITDSLHLP